VDDHPAVLKATRLLLKMEGYPVSTATSLGEACDVARANPDIEFLVTDYHLAGAELGTQVIRELRKYFGRELQAVLVSGDTSPAMNRIARDEDARIISKPIDSDQLLALMKSMLES
jgi:CheY-like chemotaxis protein